MFVGFYPGSIPSFYLLFDLVSFILCLPWVRTLVFNYVLTMFVGSNPDTLLVIFYPGSNPLFYLSITMFALGSNLLF